MLEDLIQLWLLADRFSDTQLRDCAISAMVRVSDDVYAIPEDWTKMSTPDMIGLIYSKTTAGRTRRRLAVDLYAREVDSEKLERVQDEYDPEFVKDLLMKVMQLKESHGALRVNSHNSCHYHEHDKDENEFQLCRRRRVRAWSRWVEGEVRLVRPDHRRKRSYGVHDIWGNVRVRNDSGRSSARCI